LRIRNLRWWIAGLLLLVSVKNYADRQTLSILAPTIQTRLQLSDGQYAHIVSLFLVAYVIAYLLSGRIVDGLGARFSMALFIGVWSLANLLTGFARSARSLGALRFMLGLGEAGGYTASPKVVSEWFPPKDRGAAVGLYSVGGSLGATLAPVTVIFLSIHYGWRSAFVASGLLGGVFVLLWVVVYRPVGQHPWLTAPERELIAASQAPLQNTSAPLPEKARWRLILATPAVWALMLARLLTDPVWYFFQFWLPKYFHTVRGFGQADLASLWLIFLAADIGLLGGGLLSDVLVRRGRDARAARMTVMLACAAVVPLTPLVASLPSARSALGVAMIVALAHSAWLANITTYVMDLVPGEILGTAFGFIAAGSALGGILMNEGVAWAIQHLSYDDCFYAMAVLHPLAFAFLWIFARRPWAQPGAQRARSV